MKINYVLFGKPVLTGGTKTILEMAQRLSIKGNEVTVMVFGSNSIPKWIKKTDLYPTKFKFIYVPLIGSLIYRFFRKAFQKITGYKIFPFVELQALLKHMPECDVNIGTQAITNYAVYASKKGIPVSHFMHYEPLVTEDRFDSMLNETAYLLPTKKIINSIWLRDQIKDNLGISISDSQIVYAGFYHDIFYPRKINRKNSKKRIISLAKPFSSIKGFKYLIDGIEEVLNKRDDVELVLFGTDKIPPQVIPFEFHYSPVDDQLAELYSSCDVFINASLYESFPWPPLEAMACGVPVITTRHGVEDYAIDNENALIIDPADSHAIANSVLKILENEDIKNKLIKNGLQTVKKFTWENSINSLNRILNKFLSEK